jgi:hypothetical protein
MATTTTSDLINSLNSAGFQGQALTVGELREALSRLDDDEAVVWLDVSHSLIRQPTEDYAHTMMMASRAVVYESTITLCAFQDD